MADVDLSAPVADLEDVVTTYNDAVAEAFVQFKRSVSARDFFGFLDTCRRYPLVSVNQPPRELDEYVSARPAGTEPLPTLLEYADYSPGKLKHYVEDPGALRTTVAVHQTYLDRITVEPLTIGWPPPPAAELRYLIRELIPLASRLTDDPEPVIALRDIRALTRTSRYDAFRRVALARDTLPETAQQLIAAGAVEETLDHARTTRRLCERILAETTHEWGHGRCQFPSCNLTAVCRLSSEGDHATSRLPLAHARPRSSACPTAGVNSSLGPGWKYTYVRYSSVAVFRRTADGRGVPILQRHISLERPLSLGQSLASGSSSRVCISSANDSARPRSWPSA